MATWQENIEAALNNTAALLAEITKSPKPSYSVHGHTFSWVQYQEYLLNAMDRYRVMLAQGQPYEEIGRIV